MRTPFLGWTDSISLEVESSLERRTLKDWLTYNPCAVLRAVENGGPYLKSYVFYWFKKRGVSCE